MLGMVLIVKMLTEGNRRGLGYLTASEKTPPLTVPCLFSTKTDHQNQFVCEPADFQLRHKFHKRYSLCCVTLCQICDMEHLPSHTFLLFNTLEKIVSYFSSGIFCNILGHTSGLRILLYYCGY